MVVAMGVVMVTLLRLRLGLGMVDTSMVTVVRPSHVGATVYTVMTPSRQVAPWGHVALAPRGHV